MSTVTEIKEAVSKLPPRRKLALARWLQKQVSDHLSDDVDCRRRRTGIGPPRSLCQTQNAVKFGKSILAWLPKSGRL
jgi:hypothetical protein